MRAGEGDLPALAALYVQLAAAHGESYTGERAAAKLGKALAAGHEAVLFRHRGAVIGNVLWIDLGDHVFIRNYVIDAGHRGRGLGAALFCRFRAEFLGPDTPVRLEASADYSRAFWAALGFREWSVGMRADPIRETD